MDAAGLALALLLFAPAGAAASPESLVEIPKPARARIGRGEVLVDAGAPQGPAPSQRKVHGGARLSLGFGHVLEDPVAALVPSIMIDLREIAPVRFGFAVPLRLRMADRAPDDRGVLRLQEWNEAGDFVALLHEFRYADARAFGKTGRFAIRIDAGRQHDVMLGHGSLVRGFANSLDVDRRRTGLLGSFVLAGRMVEQPAELQLDLLASDLAGSQILGTRLGGRWAGAGVGVSVVGDPTAPRQLAVTGMPESFEIGRGGQLRSIGSRGVLGAAVDLEYQATDRWRWSVGPYLDLDMLASLGKGAHVGADGEVLLGRRRGLMLGATAELTVGSAGYDPAYFDVLYTAQRWQTMPLGRPDDAADDTTMVTSPKYAFVADRIPKGVGGMGALRMSHRAGATARIEYRARPGDFGHLFTLLLGVDVPEVGVFARFAHRGQKHGFEPKLAGTLAQIEIRVPVIRWIDVEVAAGWMFAIRPDVRTGAADDGGFVAGGGVISAGVAGKVPW